MRQFMTALALATACSVAAVGAQSAPAKAKPTATKAAAKSTVATHSTTGTVKSIDSSTLVISKPGKKGDMTFTVNGSTQKDGTVGVGSNVTVRYQTEGKSMVATAISEKPAKQMASSKPMSKPAAKK
jgi:hypothetical protein